MADLVTVTLDALPKLASLSSAGMLVAQEPAGPLATMTQAALLAAASAAGALAGGGISSIDLFTNLAAHALPASVTAFMTGGYSTAGSGEGTYVADLLATSALAGSHPKFCKADSAGRYFRLCGTEVAAEHGGATGTMGINDQPAIQAAYDYAAAVGIPVVTYRQTKYELWCPLRTTNSSYGGTDSFPVLIAAGTETRGHPLRTEFVLKNSTGGDRATVTQTAGGNPWRGGCFYVKSASGIIDKLIFRRMKVTGGIPYLLATGNSLQDLTDKGLFANNADVNKLYIYDCEFSGFRGENTYLAPLQYLEVDGLVSFDSAQSCFNPTSLVPIKVKNIECYNAYIGIEHLTAGATYDDMHVHDCYTTSWVSTEVIDASSPAYWYPKRIAGNPPPFIHFGANCRVERIVGTITLQSWATGALTTVDCTIEINDFCTRDTDLDIYAWTDQGAPGVAADFAGPANLATAIDPVGHPTTYCEPTQTSHFRLHGRRTANAKANNHFQTAVSFTSGLIDAPSVFISVDGEFGTPFLFNGTPPAGFVLPKVSFSEFDYDTAGGILQPMGAFAQNSVAGSTTTLQIASSAVVLQSNDAGIHTFHIGNAYGYSDGQEFWIFHESAVPGVVHLFPASGAGMELPEGRMLYQSGDYLRLRYDIISGSWREKAYVTGYQRKFQGSASLTPASLASGAWEHIGDIVISGIAVGDLVTGVSASINTGGVALRGEVSAANTLSIYGRDDPGSTWNPGPITITGRVEKT